ncbi:MAG: YdcF family protein [Candidatus Sungbacteria bacterium]|nr:YdcF family protein [Candidatus Sungbacteria bacterium]
MEAKIRALAAGEMLQNETVEKVIFSGGKTAGMAYPSEAAAMREYLKKRYPNIEEDRVLLEEGSIDTIENAKKIADLLERYGLDNFILLLTSEWHLKRAQKVFENQGIETKPLPAEELIASRGQKSSAHEPYKKFLERYRSSSRVKIKKINEAILRALLVVDPEGKIQRRITQRRGSNPSQFYSEK